MIPAGGVMSRGRAWNWTFIAERRYLEPKRGHPTIAMVNYHWIYLKNHLEVYCLTYASCRGKKIRSVLAQTPQNCFYGTYGCSNLAFSSRRWIRDKWMSKNPNYKSNGNNNNDDGDDEPLRRSFCMKRRTRHMTKFHLGGGTWKWTFRAERRYLDPKRKYPTMSMVSHYLVHLNRLLEVYILSNIYIIQEKKIPSILA